MAARSDASMLGTSGVGVELGVGVSLAVLVPDALGVPLGAGSVGVHAVSARAISAAAAAVVTRGKAIMVVPSGGHPYDAAGPAAG